MTFAAPVWLAGAAALSLLVVALHLLARRNPRPFVYPTARFIPEKAASAPAAARRPSDLILLLLRVAIILLIGAAFARPSLSPPRHTAQLVLLDRSRAAALAQDDSITLLVRQADLVIPFDSVPHLSTATFIPGDSGRNASRGSLSAALLAAIHRAPELAASGDSLALQVISPFAEEEWDEATLAIRKLWRGRIALHMVPSATPSVASGGGSRIDFEDPLAATLALLGGAARVPARIVRTRPSAADSNWARAGGALVYWPREVAEAGWDTVRRDTAGGVYGWGRAVVAPFARTVRPPDGAVVARWVDGTAAATARTLGAGCERDIAIPVDAGSDLVLRSSMQVLVRELAAPCGGRLALQRARDARLDSLRGPAALLATSALGPPEAGSVPASAWYLAAALLLLAAEPLVRRRMN